MKITYIGHATLLIEVDGLKIVSDPWIKGSAYCDQWYQFPKALSPQSITDADYVLYSHGHEDHLHPESLKTVSTNAQIFYPYSWYGGTTEFFNELGFTKVKEVLNGQTISLSDKVRVTYLSNNLDNIIVIEAEDKVIVNINDALPSASPNMISYFIEMINRRWKKVDYVFSSYGGASYFPNTVHYSEKDDIGIAEARELFFVTNFCRIVSGLNPKFAIPFATDFILLDENQRWINDAKFPRDKIKDFYAQYSNEKSNTEIIEAYPDDFFLDGTFHSTSPYHAKKAIRPLLETVDVDYSEEIKHKKSLSKLTDENLKNLFEKLKAHVLSKEYIIPEETRKKIKFAIQISDAIGNTLFHVDFRGSETEVKQSQQADKDIDLLITLRSKTLLYAINNEWGGDAIIIGYGAEIQLYNEDSITKEYENYCVRLLSRYPNTKEYLKKSPGRALKYLLSDSTKRKNLLNRAFGNSDKIIDYTDAILSKRDLWLNKSKCDVCKACNI